MIASEEKQASLRHLFDRVASLAPVERIALVDAIERHAAWETGKPVTAALLFRDDEDVED
jgi:hypothetical protein